MIWDEIEIIEKHKTKKKLAATRIINLKINFCAMKEDLRIFAKYYDQIYLKMKDYQREADAVKEIIRQFEKKQLKTLLDVGCGTGEHVKYLSSDFQCMGIDINRNMIIIAKNKVPNAKFKVADMVNFKLRQKFDVIIGLFSSIGYAKNFNNLVKTLANFHKHLNEKGLLIVEPWIFLKDFKKGYIGLNTYEDTELKLARMATSKIVKSKWLIFMHYLIGEKGEIRYFEELHEMLALEYEDYLKAFESARFKEVKLLKEDLWSDRRGLFIAQK
jgi:SAM-dependent methyltransferase